jgi:hypothetical protein
MDKQLWDYLDSWRKELESDRKALIESRKLDEQNLHGLEVKIEILNSAKNRVGMRNQEQFFKDYIEQALQEEDTLDNALKQQLEEHIRKITFYDEILAKLNKTLKTEVHQ